MNNKVLSGIALNKEVRYFIVDSKELTNELIQINMATPTASIILGEIASITGIMSLMLKNDEKISTTITGSGEAKQVIASAHQGKVRALIGNPYITSDGMNIKEAIGLPGTLKVSKDLKTKEPFTSEVELMYGTIAKDFSYYFTKSEQIPTAITTGVLIDKDHTVITSGAMIIQLLPDASEKTIEIIEEKMKNLMPISHLLRGNDLIGIIELFFDKDYDILKEDNMIYECECNEQRFIDGIKMLDVNEIIELKKEENIECVCNFCKKKYMFETKRI